MHKISSQKFGMTKNDNTVMPQIDCLFSTDGMWCNIHVSLAPVSSLFEKATGFIIFGQLALVITKLA